MLQNSSRIYWIDYLRGFIILLVVAHHSALAYTSFSVWHKEAYILSTHPVVDSVRWGALDFLVDFDDVFFMSLLFLISGMFAKRSLGRKGARAFVRERFFRLLVPFLLGVTLLMPLAYYPAWMLAHGNGDLRSFVIDFFTVERWPVGPPWFLWVLFVFNLLLAWVYPYIKDFLTWAGSVLPSVRTGMELLLLGYIVTWMLYMPVMLWFGPDSWTGLGPFDFQVSRFLLYPGYFLLGMIIGSVDLREGLFAEEKVFMRKWPCWIGGCLVVYALMKGSQSPLRWLIGRQMIGAARAEWLYRSVWCCCCVLSCMAFLALFRRIFRRGSAWWDSLSANAFNIYLLHYVFVTWCQWALLGVDLSAPVKFLVTLLLSVAASWGLSAAVRRIWVNGLPLRPWYTKS